MRAAGSAIFVRRRDEVDIYDQVFDRFWTRYELTIEPPAAGTWRSRPPRVDHEQASQVGAGEGEDSDDVIGGAADDADGPETEGAELKDEDASSRSWSERERFMKKPFDRMSPDELRDAERLVDQVRPRLEMRRSRRQELHRHGKVRGSAPDVPGQPPERR